MQALHLFMEWLLRAKIGVLVVIASLLPFAVAAFLDIRQARQRLMANTAAVLTARGDQLAGELDAFNRVYQLSVAEFARLPRMVELCEAGVHDPDRFTPALRAVLRVQPD